MYMLVWPHHDRFFNVYAPSQISPTHPHNLHVHVHPLPDITNTYSQISLTHPPRYHSHTLPDITHTPSQISLTLPPRYHSYILPDITHTTSQIGPTYPQTTSPTRLPDLTNTPSHISPIPNITLTNPTLTPSPSTNPQGSMKPGHHSHNR